MSAGSMGCIHSSPGPGQMKTHGLGSDPGGIPVTAEPEVHPEILHLAEVSECLLSGLL